MNRLWKLAWLAMSLVTIGHALDPQKAISQFVHTVWTDREGAPQNIQALAQTRDGYLWLGTPTGLYRFDGARFALFEPPGGGKFPASRVRTLLASRDGSLWVVFVSGAVSHLLHDSVTSYTEKDGLPRVFGLAESEDGLLVAATAKGLSRFQQGSWTDVSKDWSFPGDAAQQVYFGRDGTLWVATGQKLLSLPPRGSTFVDPGEPSFAPTSFHFAQAPDGAIWFVEDGYSAHTLRSQGSVPETVIRIGAGSILFDRDGSLWMGTFGDGLLRVDAPQSLRGRQIDGFRTVAEQLTRKDGLSSEYVIAILEDREGNIWCGTPRGLDRLRPTAFTVIPTPQPGLPRAVFAAGDNTLWSFTFAPRDLSRFVHGSIKALPAVPDVNISAVGQCKAGATYLGTNRGLFRLNGARAEPVPFPKGAGVPLISAVTCDQSDGVWLLGLHSLLRYSGEKLETIADQNNLATATAVLYDDHSDRIWLGQSGRITLFDHRNAREFSLTDGVPPGTVFAIREDTAGNLWAGGDGGLSHFVQNRFVALTASQGFTPRSVFGIEENNFGYWWIATDTGIVRIARSELERAARERGARLDVESFNGLDGLPATPRQNSPLPIMTRTADGLVWIATSNGIANVDPSRIPRNRLPPPVQVEDLSVDGKSVAGVHPALPHGVNEVRIDYTALSLSIPERVFFRYTLEDAETSWHEAGTRRQAFYNHLGPGKYRFRVVACNNDGVWNETGASFDFSVEAAFYQTGWFAGLCLLSGAAVLSLLYRLRMRQLAAAMNARFDERLAERTRLAREFHDTLLQTIQGGKIVADDALRHKSDTVRMENAMERLSEWLDQPIQEGRAALSSLRTSTIEGNELAETFKRAGEECTFERPIEFAVAMKGSSRTMHPIVRDEVYRIGYEAIRNACLHSEASRVDVELDYHNDLIVRVQDDGKGMEPYVARSGKAGHFGVVGMYERAARVGGKLTITSSAEAGTLVELAIPRSLAFQQ